MFKKKSYLSQQHADYLIGRLSICEEQNIFVRKLEGSRGILQGGAGDGEEGGEKAVKKMKCIRSAKAAKS